MKRPFSWWNKDCPLPGWLVTRVVCGLADYMGLWIYADEHGLLDVKEAVQRFVESRPGKVASGVSGLSFKVEPNFPAELKASGVQVAVGLRPSGLVGGQWRFLGFERSSSLGKEALEAGCRFMREWVRQRQAWN